MVKEGLKNVAAGANPISIKLGMEKATQYLVTKLMNLLNLLKIFNLLNKLHQFQPEMISYWFINCRCFSIKLEKKV